MRIPVHLVVLSGFFLLIGCQANRPEIATPLPVPLDPATESTATSVPALLTPTIFTQVTPPSPRPSEPRIVPTILSGEIIATPMSGNLKKLIDRAEEDLARRLGSTPEEIKVILIEKAEWPDTSLGCAAPGLSRRPVTVPGYRIVLSTMDREYEYHTNRDSGIVFCPKG